MVLKNGCDRKKKWAFPTETERGASEWHQGAEKDDRKFPKNGRGEGPLGLGETKKKKEKKAQRKTPRREKTRRDGEKLRWSARSMEKKNVEEKGDG